MNAYTSGHPNSETVMRAFSEGAGIPLLPVAGGLKPGGMATYGNMRGLKPLLDQCIAEHRDWIFLDNGYFNPGHWDGYIRATRNAYMHDGTGHEKADRWKHLGKLAMPWKRNGDFVLVCPPGPLYASLRGFDATKWLSDTLATLRLNTDRELRVRVKPVKGSAPAPIAAAARGAHALVTHSSNSAVDALLAGVPVFCTAPCAAYRMGIADLRRIEAPFYPTDREQFCWNLAHNQWTLEELKDGTCWRALNG